MASRPSATSSEITRESTASAGRRYLAQVLKEQDLRVNNSQRVQSLKPLVTFEGCEYLLRGSSAANILANVGRLLSGSSGTAQTFELSAPVKGVLDVFISHNWSVGRIRKFLALAFEFNFDLASGATLLASVPLAICCAMRALPFDLHAADAPTVSGFLGRFVVGPVFLIAFGFIRDLWFFRGSGPVVFFDKTCIHQTDAAKKREGISKLGAFLASSQQMTVLYTPVYLSKLWTTYELACYLSLYDAKHLKFVPLSQSLLHVIGIFAMWVWAAMQGLAAYCGVHRHLAIATGFIIFLGYAVAQRSWAREKIDIVSRLRNFNVRDTLCAEEGDRQVVYDNIKLLMDFGMDLPVDAGHDLALDAFNALVRADLPDTVASSLGRFAFDYKHYVMIGVVATGSHMLDALENFVDGTSTSLALAFEMYLLMWVFVLWPASSTALELLVSSKLDLRGLPELLFTLVALAISGSCAAAVDLTLRNVVDIAGRSDLILFVWVCTVVASSALASSVGLGLFRRRREPHPLAQPSQGTGGNGDEDGRNASSQEVASEADATPMSQIDVTAGSFVVGRSVSRGSDISATTTFSV